MALQITDTVLATYMDQCWCISFLLLLCNNYRHWQVVLRNIYNNVALLWHPAAWSADSLHWYGQIRCYWTCVVCCMWCELHTLAGPHIFFNALLRNDWQVESCKYLIIQLSEVGVTVHLWDNYQNQGHRCVHLLPVFPPAPLIIVITFVCTWYKHLT